MRLSVAYLLLVYFVLLVAVAGRAHQKHASACAAYRFIDRADSAYFEVRCAKPIPATISFVATP